MQSYFRILSAWLNWIVCTYKFYKTIFFTERTLVTLFSESVESFEREQEKSENKQNELRKKEKWFDFC